MAPRSKKSNTAHYFPARAKDWLSSESVRLMSLAQRGAFFDLLCISWLSSDEPCTIPPGDVEIAALLGVPVEEWRAIAPRVLAEFDETTSRGRLRNAKLWSEYRAMQQKHRKQSQGGKQTALKRWGEASSLPNSLPSRLATANQNQNQNQRKTTTTALKSARGERPPASWLIPSSRVWEARFGAGSFRWAVFGRQCKGLKPHHAPATIAEHLHRYLTGLEDGRFASEAHFAKTFGDYAATDPAALVDEFGCLTPLGEKETRPSGVKVA